MLRMGALAVLGWGALLVPSAAFATACGGEKACEVAGGRYRVLVPPGWTGNSSGPATIFFHGWRSSAGAFAADPAFTAAFAAEGVLLVLPDGLNGTWAHQGSPSRAREEVAFLDAVRADLIERWNVDPARLLVTGFSQGGSIVWDLACRRGRDYAAFAAVAGAFWEPLPETCDGGPVDLLHLHGTNDPVVPMAGRWIQGTWKQGDVLQGLAVLRRTDSCTPDAEPGHLGTALTCRVWRTCGSGRELRLCQHEGGHVLPQGWIPLVHAWARGLKDRQGG